MAGVKETEIANLLCIRNELDFAGGGNETDKNEGGERKERSQ